MKTETTQITLPASVLVKSQRKTYGPKFYRDGKMQLKITATIRHDDQCGNGHNSFSITAEIDAKRGNGWHEYIEYMGGCCHDEVAKHFPELAPLLKWHLTSTDGPMHYAANGKYWAGFYGWRDGKPNDPPDLERLKSTIIYGILPTDADFDLADHLYSDNRGLTWNETKCNELMAWVASRQVALMTEFKAAVESLGLVY